jgi:hypothetical protein
VAPVPPEAAPQGVLRPKTRMLRKVEEAPEAPARPEAASSAVLRREGRSTEGRSTAASQQTCVMWSEQLEIIA